jgi:hypothetical protein
MEIVQLPVGRYSGFGERMALRKGMVAASRVGASLRIISRQTPVADYCAACADPIDFGAVWRGQNAYCSVACSLGGNRPA